MSVLIEALTLVIPKWQLEIACPGGADGFLRATLELERPPRFVCNCDPNLANLSFYDPEHLEPCGTLLRAHGLIHVDDESRQSVDFALVDQHFGPVMPCSWLEWERHKDGFTVAWLAGAEPGDMAAPSDWTAERSRGMTRTDIRDTDRVIRLAHDGEFETWLDFNTGREITGLSHPRKVDPC